MVCKHRMNFASARKKWREQNILFPQCVESCVEGCVGKCAGGKTWSGSSYHRGYGDRVVLIRPGDFHLRTSLLIEGGQAALVGGVGGVNLVADHQRVLGAFAHAI